MKGIILAGGTGSRLYPLTISITKQLLPVYDKPMVYYPLSTLISLGITEILLISAPQDHETFVKLLGNGSRFGIDLSYKIQDNPGGIAQSFLIARDFIGKDNVCLILGDNIFHMNTNLPSIGLNFSGGLIVAYKVRDPKAYGVLELDKDGNVISIEEKPTHPKSNLVSVGLYFYDNDVIKISESLLPSARGELEITDVSNAYLQSGRLKCITLKNGAAWFDAGSVESLLDASFFVKTIQERQGIVIGCPEETALQMNLVTKQDILKSISNKNAGKTVSEYVKYLLSIGS